MVEKQILSSQTAKVEFIKSMHKFIINTLQKNGNERYKDRFVIEGSSIMCHLPQNYFKDYLLPEDLVIEMKFVAKMKK